MQRKTSGTRRKENSSPKSCNLLFPAGVPRFRRRAKGEFFAIILQTSLSCRRATFPAPGKRRILLQNPAIFSFLPQRHASRTGQKENSSSKSCNLLSSARASHSRRREKGEYLSGIPGSSPPQLAFHPSDSRKKRILAKNFKSSPPKAIFGRDPGSGLQNLACRHALRVIIHVTSSDIKYEKREKDFRILNRKGVRS
ncbi:MAG: hypothetical protein VZQ80_01835 [Lachnospiraceae bacterium]|nr:hypothetical protein [Lachnospiraceae bacterium]